MPILSWALCVSSNRCIGEVVTQNEQTVPLPRSNTTVPLRKATMSLKVNSGPEGLRP